MRRWPGRSERPGHVPPRLRSVPVHGTGPGDILATVGPARPVTGHWERCCTGARQAASAAWANALRTAKNAGGWPMNSPSAVKDLIVATAAPAPTVAVGRMIETAGNLRLRKMVGSGMIRLVWKSCPPNGAALRFGNTNPVLGSFRAGALPALSCHV